MPLKHFLFLNYCHAPRVENVKARVIIKEQAVQAEKQKRREEVLIQVKKRKAVEKTVDDLYEWVDELQAELVDAKVATILAKGAAKSTQTKLDKAKTVALNRLDLLKSLKVRLDEAKKYEDKEERETAWTISWVAEGATDHPNDDVHGGLAVN